MKDFETRVINSSLDKISCDGDFDILLDEHNMQYFAIKSINTCINENGDLVAHSFGRANLTPVEIQASLRKITLEQKPIQKKGEIYQSSQGKVMDPSSKTMLDTPAPLSSAQ